MELTTDEDLVVSQHLEFAFRATTGDTHKDIIKAASGKDFRRLDAFKKQWEELPSSIRNDINYVLTSRALDLLNEANKLKGKQLIEYLHSSFDVGNAVEVVRDYAQSRSPVTPDPFKDAVVLAAIEIWKTRGKEPLVGRRDAPSEFSRFVAELLIEKLPDRYSAKAGYRTSEFQMAEAIRNAVTILERFDKMGVAKKRSRSKAGR